MRRGQERFRKRWKWEAPTSRGGEGFHQSILIGDAVLGEAEAIASAAIARPSRTRTRGEKSRGDSWESWEGEPQAARDAPKKAFRKYQPKMYPAIRSVLPLSSVAPSAAATTAEARATSAGLRPATGRIAARENPDLRPTAPEETNADAPSATDDDVDGVAHRGAANAAGDEDRDVLHLARGATRRIEEEAIAAMISRSERACA